MTPVTARQTGIRYALRAALFIFCLYEAILLYSETKGDFANGILFFMDRQMNIISILTYLVFFASFIVLGRRAGYKILLKDAKPVLITLVYSILSTVLVISVSFPQFYRIYFTNSSYGALEREKMLRYFLTSSGVILMVILLGWFYVTTQINSKKAESPEKAS